MRYLPTQQISCWKILTFKTGLPEDSVNEW